MRVKVPNNRKMQRCCRCGSMMPANKIEPCSSDSTHVKYTTYTCKCMVNVVHLKNIGEEKVDAFLVSQPKGGKS